MSQDQDVFSLVAVIDSIVDSIDPLTEKSSFNKKVLAIEKTHPITVGRPWEQRAKATK